jgi:hypothetical protein
MNKQLLLLNSSNYVDDPTEAFGSPRAAPTTEIWFTRVRFNDLDIATREKYESIFDDFEGALQRGEDSKIEEWLPKFDRAHERVVCLELVSLEIDHRLSKSETPTPEEYCERFPSLQAMDITDLFNAREATQSFAVAARDTVSSLVPFTKKIVGDFELIRKLGQGAFGEVHLAREKSLDRLVALKMPTNQPK